MFAIPLLLAVGIAVLVGRHRATATPAPSALSQGTPSPICVLDSYVQRGETPPPDVIMCAIAEAELMGRMDVAHAIVDAFIIPVVDAHDAQQMQQHYAPSRAPRASQPPPMQQQQQQQHDDRDMHHDGGHHAQGDNGQAMPINGDETAAALAAMDEMRQRDHRDEPASAMQDYDPSFGPAGSPTMSAGEYNTEHMMIVSGAAAAMSASAKSQTFAQGTERVRSPITNVNPGDWARFVALLSREPATFTGPRHVGQFRHRIDRLNELGIAPGAIVNNPEAQHHALERDLVDAHKHASHSGMFSENVGATINVIAPSTNRKGAYQISASGILGVIQAAGLEGACNWFARPGDRARFPHTTLAFLRTNGVF